MLAGLWGGPLVSLTVCGSSSGSQLWLLLEKSEIGKASHVWIPKCSPLHKPPDILLLECQALQGCLISFAEDSFAITFPCLAFNMPPSEHKLSWHTARITMWVMRPHRKPESVTVSRSIPNPQARSPRRQVKNVPCAIQHNTLSNFFSLRSWQQLTGTLKPQRKRSQ